MKDRSRRLGRSSRQLSDQVERDLVVPGLLGVDDGRRDAVEGMNGAAVPGDQDRAGAAFADLHGVGRLIVDSDEEDRARLNRVAFFQGRTEAFKRMDAGAQQAAAFQGIDGGDLRRSGAGFWSR